MLNRKILSLFGLRPTGDFGPWTFYTNKQGIPVWFIKSPPEKPPTDRQLYQRDLWRSFATKWQLLAQADRDLWELATKRISLFLTGYNLYIWWQSHQDLAVLKTIIRQSKVPIPY